MELEEAYALCRRVAHRHGPNFSVGFRFLPRRKRRAVYATYAFCRFVDDIVDEDPGADLRERVDRWAEELERRIPRAYASRLGTRSRSAAGDEG